MGLLDFFGKGNKRNAISEAIANGATIVDVRSASEFQSGHVARSVNVPLPQLDDHLAKWQSDGKSIIFCCASGIRSGSAAKKAGKAGITAFNGGGWQSLSQLLKA